MIGIEWEIKINRIWYRLCCCTNCFEVHAYHPFLDTKFGSGLMDVDEKIHCCDKPDNHYELEDANIILNRFIKLNNKGENYEL